MINHANIRLAQAADVKSIAEISRDVIEQGLEWRWTAERVLKCLRDSETNVIVSCDRTLLAGFAIMKYREKVAHLLLLAVHETRRRQGVGSEMVTWLEETVKASGIRLITLETRMENHAAQYFYQHLGYQVVRTIPGYYQGREDAVQMEKDLWCPIRPGNKTGGR